MIWRIKDEAKRFLVEDSGQGITEYGSLLAWVSVIVAIVFSLTNGQLLKGVTGAFNALASLLNAMSTTASQGPAPPANP